jgi:hypothetical protein
MRNRPFGLIRDLTLIEDEVRRKVCMARSALDNLRRYRTHQASGGADDVLSLADDSVWIQAIDEAMAALEEVIGSH